MLIKNSLFMDCLPTVNNLLLRDALNVLSGVLNPLSDAINMSDILNLLSDTLTYCRSPTTLTYYQTLLGDAMNLLSEECPGYFSLTAIWNYAGLISVHLVMASV